MADGRGDGAWDIAYQALNVGSDDASGVNVIVAANAATEGRIGTASNHPVDIYTNNLARMRIEASGAVSVSGTLSAPTAAVDTNTTQVATTAYVVGQGYLKSATASSTYAPLASPALTGNPTAPTPTAGDNDTSIATTAFVQTAVAGASSATWVKIAENLSLSGATWAPSVSLTSYNSIVIKYDAVSGTQVGGSTLQVNGAAISSTTGTTGATHTGMLWVELLAGYAYTGVRAAITKVDTAIGVTTATTTLTFGRAGGTMTGGSITVYGVK